MAGGYSVEGGRSEGRLARAGGPETCWPTVAEPVEACPDSFGYYLFVSVPIARRG